MSPVLGIWTKLALRHVPSKLFGAFGPADPQGGDVRPGLPTRRLTSMPA